DRDSDSAGTDSADTDRGHGLCGHGLGGIGGDGIGGNGQGGTAAKGRKEGVIGNNEKERREGTTLLDSPLNWNKTRGRTTEERGHFDVMKGTANEVAQPDGELGFLQDLKN